MYVSLVEIKIARGTLQVFDLLSIAFHLPIPTWKPVKGS